jgi:hypothetical protein
MVQIKESMMNQGRTNNESTFLTIEKYINDGKLNRVVIRTDRNNYLLDLPLNSFTARSFLTAAISLVKAVSLVLHNFNVAVVKFTTGNLV